MIFICGYSAGWADVYSEKELRSGKMKTNKISKAFLTISLPSFTFVFFFYLEKSDVDRHDE
jgi:hypothetical protein